MKNRANIPLLALCLLLTSCYTQLERHPTTNIKPPTGPLPDLAITEIEHTVYEQPVSHAPSQPMMMFTIHVKNVGAGDFNGSIMFNYADNWRDIEKARFPFSGGIGKKNIPAGDSTSIRLDHWGAYPPNTWLRFILRTDTYDPHTFDPVYYFGREPIVEASYENNQMDLR